MQTQRAQRIQRAQSFNLPLLLRYYPLRPLSPLRPLCSLIRASSKAFPISSEWFRRTGGEPQQGERNDRLHRLAAHLRYITDNNEQALLQHDAGHTDEAIKLAREELGDEGLDAVTIIYEKAGRWE